MSKPGIGLNKLHIVFIEKSFGDDDEGNTTRDYSEKTILENKVRFADNTFICLFHQQDKVTQIKDGKKKIMIECLK
ncbi:unnamed protein product [Paramecium sonneborni]|uniref:Uncharacterized protein n=1 Tax=Paramecium sonneborni TaxID=65129 RepID=A0A8S1LWI7_9CILI|nr:unnamed protein product [Paramecium sonneborni]